MVLNLVIILNILINCCGLILVMMVFWCGCILMMFIEVSWISVFWMGVCEILNFLVSEVLFRCWFGVSLLMVISFLIDLWRVLEWVFGVFMVCCF